MVPLKILALLASLSACSPALAEPSSMTGLGAGTAQSAETASAGASTAWPVAASLRATLRHWAERQGWPAPQFLTEVDWIVDVPGSIPGSIEEALKILAQGFGNASIRPRIAVTANHVILVSELGAKR